MNDKILLTDTHVHLYSQEFDDDRFAVIQKAIELGVKRFFLPAIDSLSTESMYTLEKEYPSNVFVMAGLHPVYVKDNYQDELEHVAQQLSKRNFVAVGEIGIDLYWDKRYLKEQQFVFKTQIQWAKKYNLPIVIHCRDAFDEIFEILEQEKSSSLHGVFHCFTGTYEQALKAISYNLKLGIGGVVTFKNGKIDQFLNKIALEHIVLETDAPYLAPVPYRGKRNESSYIVAIAQKIADIYAVSIDEVAQKTTLNSKSVFGI